MAFCDSIKLEKGMYKVGGKSFTKVLEDLDPSENYKGTALEGLDAYQRQLKRFDIKVSGPGCDMVEKFFSSTDAAVLFPEYIARSVKQGLESADVLSSIVATKTNIDGIDYRAISSTTETSSTNSVSEASALRNVNIRTKSNLISLIKHGRIINSSYEALRFQNIDVLSVILRQIGADIANEQLADAVSVLIGGDGNSNVASEIDAAYGSTKPSTPTLSYAYLLQLWEGVSPHELNVMLASTKTMKDILSLSEMKDATAGLDFQGTGKIVTPMGAKLIHAPSVTDYKILGFDKNCTLQMVQAGDVNIDYDKVIDRQLERAGISVMAGFAKIFNSGVKVLDYTISQ